ncbi:hypothetical protein ADUPG1_012773 [Aduncisulcus paluster]|uniref:BTB domain-containing protein n=1 Tax=Aduncisulcus paluster TaxID=2918883 RepID=A0ABQ5K0N5_9EUKA|nr:hypothetical protein ADUPG1_012773 [Aduncisulcus paluster]|eukprot:gnl/Carplike_NY0171/911_a1250_1972.p1 GENE.gnl/Carplike_NY0171/911_a1250_1972~~gnl/Carplike_NY0171/911_a1250_1972.p1  ORF type:complete len:495 (+),score=152.56 gnl/Carplike_NY0171/911_a1250_1972:62-1486(+)
MSRIDQKELGKFSLISKYNVMDGKSSLRLSEKAYSGPLKSPKGFSLVFPFREIVGGVGIRGVGSQPVEITTIFSYNSEEVQKVVSKKVSLAKDIITYVSGPQTFVDNIDISFEPCDEGVNISNFAIHELTPTRQDATGKVKIAKERHLKYLQESLLALLPPEIVPHDSKKGPSTVEPDMEVVMKAKDKEYRFPAHKFILSLRLHHFNEYFVEETNELYIPEMEMNVEVLRSLIFYAYTALSGPIIQKMDLASTVHEATKTGSESLPPFIQQIRKLSRVMGVPGLADIADAQLLALKTEKPSVNLIQWANESCLPAVRESVFSVLDSEAEKVVRDGLHLRMSKELMIDYIRYAFQLEKPTGKGGSVVLPPEARTFDGMNVKVKDEPYKCPLTQGDHVCVIPLSVEPKLGWGQVSKYDIGVIEDITIKESAEEKTETIFVVTFSGRTGNWRASRTDLCAVEISAFSGDLDGDFYEI